MDAVFVAFSIVFWLSPVVWFVVGFRRCWRRGDPGWRVSAGREGWSVLTGLVWGTTIGGGMSFVAMVVYMFWGFDQLGRPAALVRPGS